MSSQQKVSDANVVFGDGPLAHALAEAESGRCPAFTPDPLDVGREGQHGLTPLTWAVLRHSLPAVEWLISAGAKPAARSSVGNGRTALHAAAAIDAPVDILRALLAGGADVDVLDGRAFDTPLTTSIMSRAYGAMAALIQLGADIMRTDDMGSTPLHRAGGISDYRAVMLLLAAGARPDIADNFGTTFQPLFFMMDEAIMTREAREGRQEVIDWLISHGYAVEVE